jgi:hypothetical protein
MRGEGRTLSSVAALLRSDRCAEGEAMRGKGAPDKRSRVVALRPLGEMDAWRPAAVAKDVAAGRIR